MRSQFSISYQSAIDAHGRSPFLSPTHYAILSYPIPRLIEKGVGFEMESLHSLSLLTASIYSVAISMSTVPKLDVYDEAGRSRKGLETRQQNPSPSRYSYRYRYLLTQPTHTQTSRAVHTKTNPIHTKTKKKAPPRS